MKSNVGGIDKILRITAGVALVGATAAGFLPTAGVGAGLAMESAIVLAQHLLDAGSPAAAGRRTVASLGSLLAPALARRQPDQESTAKP